MINNMYVPSQGPTSWRFFLPEPFFLGLGISIALLGMAVPAARADCICLCVEGAVQAVCDNNIEPRPMCGPTRCGPASQVRMSEPMVANPIKERLFASPPDTKIAEDTYDWHEFGEEPE